MTRWDSDALDSTLGDIFDLGDVFDVIVGVANAQEDIEAQRQGNEKQDPGDEEFRQVSSLRERKRGRLVNVGNQRLFWGGGDISHLDSIHTKRHGGTSALHTLVVTSHTGQSKRLVSHARHGVVRQTLVRGIRNVVGHEQQQRPSRHAHAPIPRNLCPTDDRVATLKLQLERQSTSPDSAVEEQHQDGRAQCTLAPGKGEIIRQLADNDGSNNRPDTLEQGDEGARATVEKHDGDGALVAVEVIGREEHGEQGNHAPVTHELPQLGEFLAGRDGVLEFHDGAVTADDGVRGEHEPRGDDGGEHDDQEGDVDTCRDAREGGFGFDAQGDGGADDGAHLEDCPKEGEGAALVFFLGVGHHDGTLCSPWGKVLFM